MSWLDRYRPLDRYWPLGLIGAVAIAVVFVASPIWSTMSRPAPAPGPSSIVLALVYPILYSLIALGLGMSSLDARDRMRRRAAALAGNAAAIPPSLIAPDPARAPDVAHEPLDLLWRQAPAFLAHRTFGVIATKEGVIWRRPGRPDQLVRWEEARLLEVASWQATMSGEPIRTYTLYGVRTRAEWREYTSQPQSVVPHGVSYDQMVARQRLLLDLIAARTGLTPRTFDRALRSEDEPVSPDQTRRVLLACLVAVALSGILVALASEALLLPLTKWAAINAYVALSLALIALSVLVAATQGSVQRWRGQRRTDRYFLPPAPPMEASDGVFAMRTKVSRRLRLGLLFFGFLLILDAVPLVLWFVDFASVPHPEPASVFFWPLFLVSLGGTVSLLAGLIPRTTAVVADLRGVSKREGKKTETIPWEAVEGVVAHVSAGEATSFDVIGHGGAFTISWETKNIRLAEPPAGAQRVTPEEMAALVVARSGAPLRVRAVT